MFWQYIEHEANGTSKYAGVTIDILNILSKNLNFECVFSNVYMHSMFSISIYGHHETLFSIFLREVLIFTI